MSEKGTTHQSQHEQPPATPEVVECPSCGYYLGVIAVKSSKSGVGDRQQGSSATEGSPEMPKLTESQRAALEELLAGVDSPAEKTRITKRFERQVARKNQYVAKALRHKVTA